MNLGIHNQTPPEEFISVNVKCVPCTFYLIIRIVILRVG